MKNQTFTTAKSMATNKFFWMEDFVTCFGEQGLMALSWWAGAYFYDEMLKRDKCYPFLVVTGEPGSGKTTLLDFLCKLSGEDQLQGFDPSNATFAARARAFSEDVKLPVVLLEPDRGTSTKPKFDFEELKVAFSGRAIRKMATPEGGPVVDQKTTRAIAVENYQHQIVTWSEALKSRCVYVELDKSRHTRTAWEAARRLEKLTAKDLKGWCDFLEENKERFLKASARTKEFCFKSFFDVGSNIATRHASNYATVAGWASCLSKALPNFGFKLYDNICNISKKAVLLLSNPIFVVEGDKVSLLQKPPSGNATALKERLVYASCVKDEDKEQVRKADMIRCCRTVIDMAAEDEYITADELRIMLCQYLGSDKAAKCNKEFLAKKTEPGFCPQCGQLTLVTTGKRKACIRLNDCGYDTINNN